MTLLLHQCPGCWSYFTAPLNDGYECDGCGERMTPIDLRAKEPLDEIDVRRLARALRPRHLFDHPGWNCDGGVDERYAEEFAAIIAAEYRAVEP